MIARFFGFLLFCLSLTGFSQSFTLDFPRKTVLSLQNRPQWGTQIELGGNQGSISYQVYFIYQQNAQISNISFMHIQEARKQNKIQLELVENNVIFRNQDREKWLFVPYGYSYEINSAESLIFLQDFFLDPANSPFCPIIPIKLKSEERRRLSLARLIELLSCVQQRGWPSKLKRMLHVCILVDISPSMKNAIQTVKNSIENILQQYQDSPNIYFSLITFASKVEVMVPISNANKINTQKIHDIQAKTQEEWNYDENAGMMLYKNPTFTNTCAAMQKAQEILREEKDQYKQEIQRSVILISSALPFVSSRGILSAKMARSIFEEEQKKLKEIANSFKDKKIGFSVILPGQGVNSYATYRVNPQGLPSAEAYYRQIASEYKNLEIEDMQSTLVAKIDSLGGEDAPSAYYIDPEKLREIIGQSSSHFPQNQSLVSKQTEIESGLYRAINNEIGKNLVGLYMFQNDQRFIMLDWFSSPNMLLTASGDLVRRYAQQMIATSISFQSENEPSENPIGVKLQLLEMFLNTINPREIENPENYKKVYHSESNNRVYELARLSSETMIGFYVSLGEDIFHVRLLDKSN